MAQNKTVKKGLEVASKIIKEMGYGGCECKEVEVVVENLHDKVVAPESEWNVKEEKWLQTQEDLKICNMIIQAKKMRINDLELQQQRIKMLIYSFPKHCCLDEKHYCERDAWFGEVKKVMKE